MNNIKIGPKELAEVERCMAIWIIRVEEWWDTHFRGNPYFDAIQNDLMEKRIADRIAAELGVP